MKQILNLISIVVVIVSIFYLGTNHGYLRCYKIAKEGKIIWEEPVYYVGQEIKKDTIVTALSWNACQQQYMYEINNDDLHRYSREYFNR